MQFEKEVCHLMTVKHPNIVQCVGYCYETLKEVAPYNGKMVFAEKSEMLLCLEYLPTGSLSEYLSDESCGLNWSTRYKIIKGTCYGLCHLHGQKDTPIIHLDLKPTNILLSDGMIAKIADFGLSRLLEQPGTIITSSRFGTPGYMAPEFFEESGPALSTKSDIFSLGVIIIEIITGRRKYPRDVTEPSSSNEFVEMVRNCSLQLEKQGEKITEIWNPRYNLPRRNKKMHSDRPNMSEP
ncbi:probable serine/threonine-protein kinase PBL25 [Triticum aestivum]|uniref:probable serine/threonine-protein kinase PBL25 n=1 Tax=Triticum aestivum TaxID=4565 RepID=UPI001D004904|nr:probable serine/threonine-protein kinase PBL25 [Triticum aestivum]